MKTRRNSKKPTDQNTAVVHLRLPTPLVRRIKQAAAASFRTMTQEVHLRLARDLDKNK